MTETNLKNLDKQAQGLIQKTHPHLVNKHATITNRNELDKNDKMMLNNSSQVVFRSSRRDHGEIERVMAGKKRYYSSSSAFLMLQLAQN